MGIRDHDEGKFGQAKQGEVKMARPKPPAQVDSAVKSADGLANRSAWE